MGRMNGLNLPGAWESVNRNPTSERSEHPSMRVRIAAGCLTAAALFALDPAPGAGQNISSPFSYIETRQEAGPFVGYTSASRGRFGFGPAGGLLVGGRWGIELSGPLGFEAVGGVISGTRDVINPARLEGDQKIGEADVLLGSIDARLRFTLTGGERAWHGLQPYIVAGGGLVFDMSGTQAIDQELEQESRFDFGTSFLGTFGGGSRFYVTDRLALRGDAVFSLWRIDTPPDFSDPEFGLEGVEESEWTSALHFTISAVLRF